MLMMNTTNIIIIPIYSYLLLLLLVFSAFIAGDLRVVRL